MFNFQWLIAIDINFLILALADEGEACWSNYFTGTKRCKPGLRCDSRPNSDGYSGTCVDAEQGILS